MAILIKDDGTVSEVKPSDPVRGFTLAELYGYIETDLIQVITCDGQICIFDEEGKRKQKPLNVKATARICMYLFQGGHIVGHMIIATDEEFH